MGTFLARYVMTRLVDDIDGSPAVTTVSFALDGDSYEIDLSESHLSALQQALAPFVSAARAVPGGPRAARTPAPTRTPTPKPTRTPAPKEQVAAREVIPPEPAVARPAAAASPAGAPQPFRQPGPGRERAAAAARVAPAPLVADPFNPQL
jgi:hypothetical protein